MTWREELRPASYRGVRFEVVSHDLATGRRGALHEYPQQDTPYFDDLGRQARRFNVEAFVIGDEYTRQRDALLRACERPGVGILNHPFYGELRVVCTDVAVAEGRTEGGVARFQLTFVEAGQSVFPTEAISTSGASSDAADTLEDATISAFLRDFDLTEVAGSARDAIASTITDVAGDVIADLGAVEDVLIDANAILNDVPSLITTPQELASRVFGLARTIAANVDDVASIPGAFFTIDFTSGSPSGQSTGETAIRNANQSAQSLFVRAAISTEARVLASQQFESSDEAVAALDAFVVRVDAEELTVTPIEDIANPALLDLRARVVEDMRARAGRLAELTTARSVEAIPAIVLAYRLFDNAGRDGEIVRRNRTLVPHPLFVPGQSDLEVLSQ